MLSLVPARRISTSSTPPLPQIALGVIQALGAFHIVRQNPEITFAAAIFAPPKPKRHLRREGGDLQLERVRAVGNSCSPFLVAICSPSES